MEYQSVIPLSEQRALRAFCRLVAELSKTRFFGAHSSANHKIKLNVEDEPQGAMSGTEYDLEDLRSFLVLFRRLVAETEATNIYRVLAIVGRYSKPETKDGLRMLKKEFKADEASTGGLSFRVGPPNRQREFTPRVMRDLYFNAGLFHDDETLAADRALLRDFEPMVVFLLVRYVLVTTARCMQVADGIRTGGFLEPNSPQNPGPSTPT